MSLFADAAAYYVGLGWKVFPLAAGRKLPALPAAKGGQGFKDATDDAAVIDAMARRFPNANIGIATGATSGFLVVDIDPRNGGADTIARLAGSGRVFPPDCPEARTGNGGRHLFFAFDPAIKTSKNRLGIGIDIKSDGGYVVGAPSVIAASEQGPGGQYRWVRKPSLHLPRLPAWAVARLTKTERRPLPKFEPIATAEGAQRSLEGMARRLASAPTGHRNDLLNWCAYTAGNLVRQGRIGASVVSSRLTQAALAAGLTLPEVQATIASGLRGALDRGGRQ
jgi:Bifunctional DNA primase/polymerase, N-terminal